MTRPFARALLALVVTTAAASRCAAQEIFASSGFNDASGMNSNPTPNSPYVIGQTVAGRGVGEAGWAGAWFAQNGGAVGGDDWALVQAVAAREGDGGLSMTPGSLGSTRAIRQLGAPLDRTFVIEQDVNFGSVGFLQSAPFQAMLSEGDRVGPMWRIAGPVGDRRFEVFDGQSNQLGAWEDTGIDQTPGEWQHVVMVVNVAAQTFTLSVDNTAYTPADPTGFFNAAAVIDHVDYFTNGSGYVDGVIVRAVPEPVALMSVAACAGVFVLRPRRKRA